MTNFKTLVLCLTFALALTACQGTPEREQPVPVDLEADAKAYLANGRLQLAADEYLRLAEQEDPSRRAEFTMKAAFILTEAGEPAFRRSRRPPAR